MQRIISPNDMQESAIRWRGEERRVFFVPTMGALHAGHASLMTAARAHPDFRPKHDKLVVSIFVNPIQFNDTSDLAAYPQPIAEDKAMCEAAGVDCLFLPQPENMYPSGFQTNVHVAGVSQGLCGKSRPGHFDGVATVVLKLFNLVAPTHALFGEKDFQQLAVIKRMVLDLNLPVSVIPCPTVRESDGLAMSSRNSRLSAADRPHALVLYRALEWARGRLQSGDTSCLTLKDKVCAMIAAEPHTRLDYAEFVHNDTLEPLETCIAGKTRLVLAAFVGEKNPIRLIDNMWF